MPGERRGAGRWSRRRHVLGTYLPLSAERLHQVETLPPQPGAPPGACVPGLRTPPVWVGCRSMRMAWTRCASVGSDPQLTWTCVRTLVGETINWRAGCGKSARPVRREGGPNSIGPPYPYREMQDYFDET